MQTTRQHRGELTRGNECRLIFSVGPCKRCRETIGGRHVSTATLTGRRGSDKGKIQIAARPVNVTLATQSGDPIRPAKANRIRRLYTSLRSSGLGSSPDWCFGAFGKAKTKGMWSPGLMFHSSNHTRRPTARSRSARSRSLCGSSAKPESVASPPCGGANRQGGAAALAEAAGSRPAQSRPAPGLDRQHQNN